ncbi:MAG: hypothetical protein VYC03_04310, partial [Pseudomonadota bacterium]|nr:hypothetical protein [Pseudomonadota bacterium]
KLISGAKFRCRRIPIEVVRSNANIESEIDTAGTHMHVERGWIAIENWPANCCQLRTHCGF